MMTVPYAYLENKNPSSKNCYARQDYVEVLCDVRAAVPKLV